MISGPGPASGSSGADTPIIGRQAPRDTRPTVDDVGSTEARDAKGIAMLRLRRIAVGPGSRKTAIRTGKGKSRAGGWLRGRAVAVTALAAACVLVAGAGEAAAADGKEGKEGNHCISPEGADLNEFYGVSVQIVASFCAEVGSGEQWTMSLSWRMNHTFEAVPEGFVPAGTTPLEDFLAKFSRVKYVIDPGTKHSKTTVFQNGSSLFIGTFAGFPRVSPVTLGTLKAPPVGEHTVEVYWEFSAMHCDGFDTVIPKNCIPAGETKVSTVKFEVTPGHR
jgi:hypothetical protein